MLVLGWAAMSLGMVLFSASLVVTLRANPDTIVPYNRNPLVVPRYSILMRSVGAGLIVIAIAALLSDTGPWPVVIPALIAVVGLGLVLRHNASVKRSATRR
ncbi:hypothetical protein [Agrococcus casei]|uniref:hypothetical protein n=1 Tax=Agrococcus casei TaxID=343512 RepID=UPI003F92B4A9